MAANALSSPVLILGRNSHTSNKVLVLALVAVSSRAAPTAHFIGVFLLKLSVDHV